MFRYFLLTLYLLIPYFPLFGEIDRIGSQILSLSILNFVSIGHIFNLKKQTEFVDLFKKNEILFYAFFLVFTLISGFKAINSSEFVIEFLRTVTYFISLLVFLVLIYEEKHKNYIIWIVILTLILDVFGLFVQNLQGLGMIGFTANKNVAAFSLVIKSCYLFMIINRYKSFFIRSILFSFYCIMTFVLLKINSKGAIIAFIFSLLYFIVFGIYLFKRKKAILINSTISFLLVLSTVFVTNLDSNTTNAFKNTTINFYGDEGNTSRIRYLKQAFNSFLENPFFGVGYGNWKLVSIKYDASQMRDYVVQYYTHNDYIQILTETGIFGFISYLSIFLFLIIKFVKRALVEQNNLMVFIGMALLIYMFDALINFPAFRVTSQLNLILIIVILNFKQKNEK